MTKSKLKELKQKAAHILHLIRSAESAGIIVSINCPTLMN